MKSIFKSLFNHCEFTFLAEADHLDQQARSDLDRLLLPSKIADFHPKRAHEFKLGRLCAHLSYQKLTTKELFNLPMGEGREPLWPSDVVGSISHCAGFVCAAVGAASTLNGVGVDLETWGRVKEELASSICVAGEFERIKMQTPFSPTEALTLVFSAKEALYKALYSRVGRFFGFSAAEVLKIRLAENGQTGTFDIALREELTFELGPSQNSLFTGSFGLDQGLILCAIED